MIKKIIKENLVYLIAIILFIVLASNVNSIGLYKYILEIDNFIIEKINLIIDSNLTAMFKFITLFGDWYFSVFIILITLIFIKEKKYSIILGINYILSFILSFLTKIIISRPRPLNSIIPYPDQYSFPSGHTLTSIAFYIMLYYLISKTINNKIFKNSLLILIVMLLILIAFSRIYLGVHYFSDVIGGIILGILFISMNINILKKQCKKI